MNILKIVSGSDGGGVFTCEKQFISELKNTGVTVDVIIVGEGGSSREYEALSDRSIQIPALKANYGGPVLSIMSSIVKTYQYGADQGRAIAHQLEGASTYDAVIYRRPMLIHLAGKLAQELHTMCLWHMPNIARTFVSRTYYNYFCSKYGITQVANSSFTQRSLGEQCKHVVYPGFDKSRVAKSAATFRNTLALEERAPVYGVAARMHKDKAQDLVVEAFISSNVPANGGHLLIAGGSLTSEYAQKVMEKAGALLNKQVHFLGEISSMPEFYSSVDIVINGRRNVEPFGITIAEAMGAGKPVIAYKLGGPAEMITHGVNGWLVDSPTVQGYRVAFNDSISKRDQWGEMGRFAQENSSKFSVEENVHKLKQILRNGNGPAEKKLNLQAMEIS